MEAIMDSKHCRAYVVRVLQSFWPASTASGRVCRNPPYLRRIWGSPRCVRL